MLVQSLDGLELLNPRLNEIGTGYGSRAVFAVNKHTVVKVTRANMGSANEMEFHLWLAVQDTKWADYFFPCIDIIYQPDGSSWLLMERAIYVPEPALTKPWDWSYTNPDDRLAADHLLQAAKKFQITDVKPQNVGIRQDGRWALLDYNYYTLPTRLPRRRKTRVSVPQ